MAVKNKKIIIGLTILSIFLSIIAIKQIVFAQTEIKTDENKIFDSIIIIGDSRMALIANKKDYNKTIPTNVHFIAQGGKELVWFNEVAIKRLSYKLDDFSKNKAVIMNMGVNDLQVSSPETVNVYIENFKMLF